MEIELFLWVLIAAVLLAVAVFHIRTMIEVRRAAMTARESLARLDAELFPVVREAREILMDLRVTASGIASRVEDVKSAMEAVGDTGRNISRINRAVGEVADFVTRVNLLTTGVKAAGKYVVDRISKKRG